MATLSATGTNRLSDSNHVPSFCGQSFGSTMSHHNSATKAADAPAPAPAPTARNTIKTF